MDKVIKYSKDLRKLDKCKDYDTFFGKASEVIKRDPAKAFSFINSVDMSSHTVPITYILSALYRTRSLSDNVGLKELIVFTRNFFYEFNKDELSRSTLYMVEFYQLAEIFAFTLSPSESDTPHWQSHRPAIMFVDRPLLGIKPLRVAIRKLQNKDTEFTPLHTFFAMLCLHAKAYRQSRKIIEKKLLSGFVNSFHDLEGIMNYNYFRGLLYIGLENYAEARHCFQLVLDTPYQVLHITQVMAFKKICLLIWLTSTHNIQDDDHKAVRLEIRSILQTKGILGKQLEEICEEYCKTESINSFFIQCNHDSIIKDTNMGLVKQVIRKIRNEVLESMTQTNTMLTLEEIDERLTSHRLGCDVLEENQKTDVLKGLKDAVMEDSKLEFAYNDEDLNSVLIKMVKSGKINAKIDMKKQIVVFEDNETSVETLVKKLQTQNDEIIEVLAEVENTDKQLLLQKKEGIHDAEMNEPAEYMDQMMFMDDP